MKTVLYEGDYLYLTNQSRFVNNYSREEFVIRMDTSHILNYYVIAFLFSKGAIITVYPCV